MWNITRPEQELKHMIQDIELRGYNKVTFLTGEFAWKLKDEKIRPLSVSNIADKYCPKRRDLYFSKGTSRPSNLPNIPTWGGKTGYLVEDYIRKIVENNNNIKDEANIRYPSILKHSDNNHNDFINSKIRKVEELKRLEETDPTEKGNTDWLIKLLKSNGRAEFALKHLNEMLKESISLTAKNIESEPIDIFDREEKQSHIRQIGINLPAVPDFIIPKYGIVGDIKTGTEFKSHFQLTCAGYALAYENVMGKGHDINWGIVYFLPTRNPSWFVKPITFAQIYIFPIDDYLRQWFISTRDEAYSVISKQKLPKFPMKNEREHCKHCKYKELCEKEGLQVEE